MYFPLDREETECYNLLIFQDEGALRMTTYRFHSVMAALSRANSVSSRSFCAEENNTLILDNAIALSIFVIALILLAILIVINGRNQSNPKTKFSLLNS